MRFKNNKRSIGAALQIFSASILLMVTSAIFAQEAGGSLLLVRKTGFKLYELQDHLNNSRAVVSDIKIPLDQSDHTKGFKTVLLSSAHYDPFGMELPDRAYFSKAYRYGFNGKEKDDEWKGTGNSYDFGARIYDPRIARWLSTDPLDDKYPSVSPYNFALNNPITFIDPDGRDVKVSLEYNSREETVWKQLDDHDIAAFEGAIGYFTHKYGPDLVVTSGGLAPSVLGGTGFYRDLAHLDIPYDKDNVPAQKMVFNDNLIGIGTDRTVVAAIILQQLYLAKENALTYGGYGYSGENSCVDESIFCTGASDMLGYDNSSTIEYTFQWEQMAEKMASDYSRGKVIQGMKDYDAATGNDKWFSLTEMKTIVKHDGQWYEAMSWIGLTGTEAWEALDKKTKKKYLAIQKKEGVPQFTYKTNYMRERGGKYHDGNGKPAPDPYKSKVIRDENYFDHLKRY
jgi:RHS repeat-associated protein